MKKVRYNSYMRTLYLIAVTLAKVTMGAVALVLTVIVTILKYKLK